MRFVAAARTLPKLSVTDIVQQAVDSDQHPQCCTLDDIAPYANTR